MTNSELKSRLNKSLDFFKSELVKIRTGRATPSLIEDVTVEAYGAKMTLKELGSTTLLDTQNLTFSPWDKTLLKEIAKAILESGLGLNPVTDGETIRVPVPALTSDRRAELVKMVSAKAEAAKNTVRDIRQDAMKEIDRDFADKKIGEDPKFTLRDEVEKTIKDFISQIDALLDTKKEELLKV